VSGLASSYLQPTSWFLCLLRAAGTKDRLQSVVWKEVYAETRTLRPLPQVWTCNLVRQKTVVQLYVHARGQCTPAVHHWIGLGLQNLTAGVQPQVEP